MGANVRWIVYGYRLVEHECEVSALTYADALEEAEREGMIKPYDAQFPDYEEESDDA